MQDQILSWYNETKTALLSSTVPGQSSRPDLVTSAPTIGWETIALTCWRGTAGTSFTWRYNQRSTNSGTGQSMKHSSLLMKQPGTGFMSMVTMERRVTLWTISIQLINIILTECNSQPQIATMIWLSIIALTSMVARFGTNLAPRHMSITWLVLEETLPGLHFHLVDWCKMYECSSRAECDLCISVAAADLSLILFTSAICAHFTACRFASFASSDVENWGTRTDRKLRTQLNRRICVNVDVTFMDDWQS